MADKKKAPAVGDARFQKVHNDPRFARLSAKKNKLQIDKRFAAVLKDDKFQAVQGKYDKYGRRIDKKENELKKFYRLDDESEAEEDDGSSADEEEEETKAKTKSDSDSDDSEEEEAEGDGKMSRLDFLNRMARGELESGSDTSDSSDDSDEDVEMEEAQESEKEDIPLGDETKRFAVMNCDWTRIRAVDLFALFESFAPATGAVKDVTIYPSDFGLERMKEEEQHGPRALFADKKKETEKDGESDEESSNKDESDQEEEPKDEGAKADDDSGSDGDENEEGEGYDSDDPLGVKKSVTAKEEDGFDVEKLRKYELQKLKYYYAVVTCDSVKTASAIYENCDQLEYETSSNLLDLRFIPDDMEFKNQPKETCQSVPESYKPAIFATQALQRTDVKLTWEEDDESRVELLTRQCEWKNAHDDDFAAYLASENSSSEEEDGEEESEGSDVEKPAASNDKSRADRKKAAKLKKIKNRYRKMLLGSDAEDSDDDENDAANASGSEDDESSAEGDSADEKPEGMSSDSEGEQGEGEGGNMELTFTPGAGDILKAKRQKELEANETPFERYVREKKQEKNKKRHEKRALQKQQARDQKDVLKKKGKMAPEQLKALRAAIDDDEDGGSDDEDGDRNFDMKKIALNEKVKKLKGKRKSKEMKKLEKKSGLQEGFEFDAADPRFGALYEKGSQFQLDPTDPKFKKTEATQAIFQERRKRQSEQKKKPQRTPANQAQAADAGSKKDSKNELKAMVENLKRKAPPQAKKNAAPMKPFKKPKV